MKNSITYFLLGLIIYFFLFHRLDSRPIQNYDEARLAINALEMVGDGDLIVTHFDTYPEEWNTKPPLVVWFQAISIRFFGASLLSVRLPTAIASCMTAFFLFLYILKKYKSSSSAFIVVLILLTSFGYNRLNITRVADYNATLVLFCTIACISFFEMVHFWNSKHRDKWMISFFISMVLGVYTKSIAILLFGPAFMAFLLIECKFILFIKDKDVIYYTINSVLIIALYYLFREFRQEGFIDLVIKNELGGRYLETIEFHKHPWSYYVKRIHGFCFTPWVYFLPLSVLFNMKKEWKYNSIVLYLFLCAGAFLFVISGSATKLETYDAPIYPLLSIIVGVTIIELFQRLTYFIKLKIKYLIIPLISFLLLFGFPVYISLQENYIGTPDLEMDNFGYFIKHNPNIDSYLIADLGYNAHLLFYDKMYAMNGQKQITRTSPKLVQVTDTVLVCQEESKNIIHRRFDYELLKEELSCKWVVLDSKKE